MEDNFMEKFDLDTTMSSFFKKKEKLDYYKKETELENKKIKDLMNKLNLQEYENDDGLVAKITTQNRDSFNNDRLLEKLKELNAIEAIKTIEVVDMDKLEDLIYNGKLDASKLTDCKESKQVVTLKVTKKKGA